MPNPAVGDRSPITVVGLTAGVAYYVQIQHRNSAGWGPLSDASASFTPTATSYAQKVIASAPLGFWRFGEIAGSEIAINEMGR